MGEEKVIEILLDLSRKSSLSPIQLSPSAVRSELNTFKN